MQEMIEKDEKILFDLEDAWNSKFTGGRLIYKGRFGNNIPIITIKAALANQIVSFIVRLRMPVARKNIVQQPAPV